MESPAKALLLFKSGLRTGKQMPKNEKAVHPQARMGCFCSISFTICFTFTTNAVSSHAEKAPVFGCSHTMESLHLCIFFYVQ